MTHEYLGWSDFLFFKQEVGVTKGSLNSLEPLCLNINLKECLFSRLGWSEIVHFCEFLTRTHRSGVSLEIQSQYIRKFGHTC